MKRLVIVGLCLALCAAWGCASGAKADRGQGKMAVTWSRQHEKETAETAWDSMNGVYISERVFYCDAEVSSAIGDAGATGDYTSTFTITHTDSTTVTMVDVARRGKRLKEGGSEITVTYEGHWLGVLPLEFNAVGTQKKLLFTYQDGDTAPHTIGPNGEGTNVVAPKGVLTLRKNIGNGAGLVKWFDTFIRLAGFVNENNWSPASLSDIPGDLGEGWWLYLGHTIIKNRDGTYTVTALFAPDVENTRHKLQYNKVADEDQTIGGVTVRKGTVLGATQTDKIYRIAGTDETTTGAKPKFADMEL